MKAVFTSKVSPAYDDLPESRYHFPRTYINQVSRAVGDWVVYYEPRRASADTASTGGRQAYFAIAQVVSIEADSSLPGHFYAYVQHYLPFGTSVPFSQGDKYFEAALQKVDGSTNRGAFGRAVRNLSDTEFSQICIVGFGHAMGLISRERPAPDVPEDPLQPVSKDFGPAHYAVDRPVISTLTSRLFRDRAFSAAVKSAYRDTCAITGLKIINGGGRSEVQAAHIRPVADRGPDSVRNGLALSATAHWMFDRGLISIDDDWTVLLSRNKVPDAFQRFMPEESRILLPSEPDLHPHPEFLRYHRENVYKE